MSHYNIIHDRDPATVTEKRYKGVARRLLLINNPTSRVNFDSAEHFIKLEQEKKERETATQSNCLLNPPLVMKKFPTVHDSSNSRKKFDSADYFLEIYQHRLAK